MIDIHTHLLPFVDDGVRDFNEALNAIEALKKQGVEKLFITPHFYKLRNFVSTHEENLKLFKKLTALVKEKNFNIELFLGTEIYYNQKTLKNIQSGIVSDLINDYYLIEFSTDESLYNITEAIHNFVAKGYKPIIAHIERYKVLNKFEDVSGLKKIGALMQVNAGSVLGNSGFLKKNYINKLIKRDLVDFVATDSHSYQKGLFLKAYEYVKKKFSKDIANKLFNNQILFTK
ncbi:MAG: CpsB/CapC family capsule biosynthesis tyrosine phosphatase [Bacillota bacterium]